MSPKSPRVTADKMARALERHGSALVHQSGGHRICRNGDGVRVTLPMHAGRILHPRIVRTIMEDAGIRPEDL